MAHGKACPGRFVAQRLAAGSAGLRPEPRWLGARLISGVILILSIGVASCEDGSGADGPGGAGGHVVPTDAGQGGHAGNGGGAGGTGGSPGWWMPAPGETADWDWQIAEPYDLSAPRLMYDLDLFDLATPGSYLAYENGPNIDVPPGPLAGTIGALHERVPRATVVCYVDSGAYEHYRPDASRFPGYHPSLADMPNRPDPPEPGSIVGWDTGWDGERWLDIRSSERAAFAPFIWARLDLAKRLGCDAVEPDQNNPLDNDPGFPITLEDQTSWYAEVAAQAHARGMSVGMKNGHDQVGAVELLVGSFDWALPEECAEFGECAMLLPFVQAGKAVFAVDYQGSVDEDAACTVHLAMGFDGLIKDEPPTGAYRRACAP